MALWYFLQKGRPFGPVTTDDVKKEIAGGRLGASDLIYQERDTSWKPAREFSDFKSYFPEEAAPPGHAKEGSGPPSAEAAVEWVLLMRKADGSGYRQRGPFSQAQILIMLKKGEITFTDHVWRKGLKEWYKILAIPEFHPSFVKEAPRPAPPLPKPSFEEAELSADLSEITMKLPIPYEEPVPAEASQEFTSTASKPPELPQKNAARISWEEIAEQSQKIKVQIKRSVKRSVKRLKHEPLELARRTGVLNYYLELTAVKKALFLSGVAAVLVLGLLSLVYISSFLDRENVGLKWPGMAYIQSKLRSKPVVVDSKAPEKPSPPAVVPATEMPRIKPTFLRYAVVANGTGEAKLRILTDGSSHFPVTVVFTGGAGQVVDAKSVARVVRLTKTEDRDVPLKSQRLPAGFYDVIMAMEDLKVQGRVDFGTDEADFKKRLRTHRKRLIYDYNNERYSFIKTIGRLEKETYKFTQNVENAASLKSWSSFYRNWREGFERIKNPNMTKISGKNRNTYVHADKWLELKELHAQIVAETRQVNAQKTRKDTPSVAGLKTAASKLSKLKEEMISETMWRRD